MGTNGSATSDNECLAPAPAEDVVDDWRYSARAGDLEEFLRILKLCGERGCATVGGLPLDVNFQDDDKNTALHFAAANGHVDIVRYLLENGARHLPNTNGNYPLHWLVLNKQLQVLLVFLDYDRRNRCQCAVHLHEFVKNTRNSHQLREKGCEHAQRRRSESDDKRFDGGCDTVATPSTPNSIVLEEDSPCSRSTKECGENGGAKCTCRFSIDVLAVNNFGKSALSEAFTASDVGVLQCLLEHPSAKELEKAYDFTAKQAAPVTDENESEEVSDVHCERVMDRYRPHAVDSSTVQTLTHRFQFDLGGQACEVACREVALDWKGAAFGSPSCAAIDDTTGLALWSASLVGASWIVDIAHQHPEIFESKEVLELGAGCGLMGITTAKLQRPPKWVTFTDVFEKTLDNLKHNCIINGLMDAATPVVAASSARSSMFKGARVIPLDWSDSETWPRKKTETNDDFTQFDVIVASDLVYEVSAAPLLSAVVSALLKKKTGCLFYVHRMKRQGASHFVSCLKKIGLKIEELSPPDAYKQNKAIGKNDEEFHLLFSEMETCDDFVLLRAAWR